MRLDVTQTSLTRVHAFGKNDGVDFISLLHELNSSPKNYSVNEFWVKEACIMNHLNSRKTYLFLGQIIMKMSNSLEFSLCYKFWYEFDILGSMT